MPKSCPAVQWSDRMRFLSIARITNRNSIALAGLRIAIGCLFLIFAQYKVFGTQFTLHGGFQWWINEFLRQGAYPMMMPILQRFVLPHATVIAFLPAPSDSSTCCCCCSLPIIQGVGRRFGNISGHHWIIPFSHCAFLHL